MDGDLELSSMKLSHFFKSLLKMRPQQALDLKNLLREVLLGEQTPEEFTIKLREVTKSQDKGNLLPFLKKALPALRKSIRNGEHLDLRESLSLDLDGESSVPTPQLPSISNGNESKSMVYLDQQNNNEIKFTPTPLAENEFGNENVLKQENSPNAMDIGEEEIQNGIAMADNLNNLPQMLLNPQALADRILAYMPDEEGVDPDLLLTISNAAETRLRSMLAHLAVLAEHRLEPLRINPMYRVIDEPRKQLRFMEDIEKRAHDSRQTAEKEALLKITKSKGKDKDTLEKAKQIQKADREALVNREANAAAFAALGGNKIASKRAFGANMGADWRNGMQNQGLGAGLTGMTGRGNRLKRVTIRDLQFFLGTDPSIPTNSKLRNRIGLASVAMDENVSL